VTKEIHVGGTSSTRVPARGMAFATGQAEHYRVLKEFGVEAAETKKSVAQIKEGEARGIRQSAWLNTS
jgi:hypothetical protein